jgi:hypothetical protein
MSYRIIDPPVTVYSSQLEIEQWLTELRNMPESKERDRAIKQAERWLEFKRKPTDIPEGL